MAGLRLQFRLRTLLIGFTVAAAGCGYVLHERHLVEERRALIGAFPRLPRRLFYAEPRFMTKIPWVRRWLGDFQYDAIAVGDTVSDDVVDRFKQTFPEAEIVRRSDDGVFARLGCRD